MRRYHGISSSVLLIVLLTGAAPAQALTIVDTFSGSVTSAANAAQIEATIQSASNAIASLYSNAFTATINFQLTSTGLGGSSQNLYAVSYASYTQALKNDSSSHSGNTTLATAVTNLSKGNDAGGKTPIALTSSLVDALGLGNVSAGGTVYLNSSLMYFGTGQTPSGLYSGTAVIQHEIDEILGGGGAGSTLGTSLQGYYYGSLDLYRYSASGTASYTTNSSSSAYYSINGGATSLVAFNQTGRGDYGDFYNTCLIQNYAGCPGHTPEAFAGSIESTMLQSIGYDLVGGTAFISAAPAPSSGEGLASLFFLTVVGAAAKIESRRSRAARL
ncbi:NF038122 family metalloprotease [Methylocystis bryophila]|uniref:PEP-CTERM sorting domain-containing protein n=1 Tax=Methylocystis bryophila TaxID=655015 RepID=A0A1W6MYT4_9HYPH|nr:NF038122 family metalloprotease [Methylocystis bryophila]ARN82744.1 hypothetical protein B1812_18450 [Methylocystis bryophila]BDV38979.1 hypothetical protein DSM21852_22320 [Methylocystis bryophila]